MKRKKSWAEKFLKRAKVNESTISTILGVLVIIVIGVLIFNYFRGIEPKSEKGEIHLESEEGKSGKEIEEVTLQELPTTHKVKRGEHLWALARRYYGSGYNWVDIVRENKLNNPNIILVGQELKIPKVEVIRPHGKSIASKQAITGEKYTVVKGDHLWGIAVRAYGDGYRWTEIATANHLANPSLIHPGNILTIPR